MSNENVIRAWAVKEAGGKLERYDFDAGELGADDVEIKVEYCGVCHSDLSMMSEYEEHFVNSAVRALEKNPQGLNRTQMLEATGHQKTDNNARDTLKKFTDKFWKEEKQKGTYTYRLINQ